MFRNTVFMTGSREDQNKTQNQNDKIKLQKIVFSILLWNKFFCVSCEYICKGNGDVIICRLKLKENVDFLKESHFNLVYKYCNW